MAKSSSVAWTREHYLIALNLYCKLPFGKFHHRNPLIIDVAKRMGRTPSSLAMKLSNFAALDPVHRARGIKGLSGASAADHRVWEEFHGDLPDLAPESEQLLHDLFTKNDEERVDLGQERGGARLIPPSGPTERRVTVKVRRGQDFFRDAVINAYGTRCCISGVAVRELLVASHIKPWSVSPEHRLDLRNGLCLSSLHDAAFDRGLITLDDGLRLVVGSRLKRQLSQRVLKACFAPFEGQRISLPEKLAEPAPEHLAYHRKFRFER